MEVSISPDLQRFIEQQIRAGLYKSAEEVIQSALAHLAAIANSSSEETEELRRELAEGLKQADRGEFVSFTAEDVILEGSDLLARRHKAV